MHILANLATFRQFGYDGNHNVEVKSQNLKVKSIESSGHLLEYSI